MLHLAAPFCLGVWLAALSATSPPRAEPPRDWDPVSAADLAYTASTIEPGAGAEALFWRVSVEDVGIGGDLRQVQDHYVRIKIHTEAGAQAHGTIGIEYPSRDGVVQGLEARTIRPDGSVVPLDPATIAAEVVLRMRGEEVRRQTLALPQLGPGCILEYRYRLVLRGDGEGRFGPAYLPTGAFDLQRDIPVKSLSVTIKPLGLPRRLLRFHADATTCRDSADGSSVVTVSDQPAFKKEPFSPPEYQQRPWMLHFYAARVTESPTSFWQRFALEQNAWYVACTKPNREILTLAAGIVGDATSTGEQVQRLVEWIQREFHVIPGDSLRARDARRSPRLREVVRRGAGSAEEASLLFGALARSLRLETRLLRVPSRRFQFFDPEVMLHPGFLPELQIAVRLAGNWFSFCPAGRRLPWDMVPWHQEAQQALLCDPSSPRFVAVPGAPPERSRVTRTGALTVAEDGTVAGDVALEFSGHLNETIRSGLEGLSGAALDSTLFGEVGWTDTGIELSRVVLVNGTDERAPLEVRCHVRLPGHAAVTGRRILLDPAVFHARKSVPFTSSARHAPVYFRFAWSERDSLSLRLPEGWKVEAVEAAAAPAPAEAPGVAGYASAIRTSDDGREIVVVRTLRVGDDGTLVFPPDRYPELKRLFDRIHDRDGAVVTLVRAADGP